MKGLETFGWIVFILSSVTFLISGIVAGDPWSIAGSAMFLVGVVALWIALGSVTSSQVRDQLQAVIYASSESSAGITAGRVSRSSRRNFHDAA